MADDDYIAACLLLQVKMQSKTDRFTMEIMKGRDDRRPLVSIGRILHAA